MLFISMMHGQENIRYELFINPLLYLLLHCQVLKRISTEHWLTRCGNKSLFTACPTSHTPHPAAGIFIVL